MGDNPQGETKTISTHLIPPSKREDVLPCHCALVAQYLINIDKSSPFIYNGNLMQNSVLTFSTLFTVISPP